MSKQNASERGGEVWTRPAAAPRNGLVGGPELYIYCDEAVSGNRLAAIVLGKTSEICVQRADRILLAVNSHEALVYACKAAHLHTITAYPNASARRAEETALYDQCLSALKLAGELP